MAPSAHGLARTELVLFVFGVLAFAFLMLVFADPVAFYLPVIALWVVGGLAFVWWFDRYLARQGRDR